MMIQVLAPDVAARIAAGEVVERPANAAKELIENSLDAGATVIRVEIREGGRRLLRVTDNGSGIPAAEAPTALMRHATSKLQTSEELEHIGTFGFRGEALYSIAAVSHMVLQSRHRDEEFAAVLATEGGRLVSSTRMGAPAGTSVSVEHLFFNTPARLKFLRSAVAEAGQIASVVQRYALAFPECRFTFVNEQRTIFQTTGSGSLFDVVVQIYGLEAARQMAPFDSLASNALPSTPEADPGADVQFGDDEAEPEAAGDFNREASGATVASTVRVHGFASMPSLTRGNRTGVQVFVNRRAVEDRNLTFAVVQAYHTLLQVGRYPIAILFLEMDPSLVDVNVHPQKLQVRFAEDRIVFNQVQKTVRRAILEHLTAPGIADSLPGGGPGAPASTGPSTWNTDAWAARREAILNAGNAPQFGFASAHTNLLTSTSPAGAATDADEPDFETAGDEAAALPAGAAYRVESAYTAGSAQVGGSYQQPVAPEVKTNLLPPLRVVGQVGATYIVAEGPAGMFLVDQHAAHERILYEQFMDRRYGAAPAGQGAPSQQLLQPVILHDGSEEAGQVATHLHELQRVGFQIEPFGGDSFILRAVPSLLAGQDPLDSLLDIVSSLASGRNLVSEGYESALVKMVCKRAAIKAGQLLSVIEMQELLRQLEECRSPRTCPHGRPTVIQISAGDLQKAFGRI